MEQLQQQVIHLHMFQQQPNIQEQLLLMVPQEMPPNIQPPQQLMELRHLEPLVDTQLGQQEDIPLELLVDILHQQLLHISLPLQQNSLLQKQANQHRLPVVAIIMKVMVTLLQLNSVILQKKVNGMQKLLLRHAKLKEKNSQIVHSYQDQTQLSLEIIDAIGEEIEIFIVIKLKYFQVLLNLMILSKEIQEIVIILVLWPLLLKEITELKILLTLRNATNKVFTLLIFAGPVSGLKLSQMTISQKMVANSVSLLVMEKKFGF